MSNIKNPEKEVGHLTASPVSTDEGFVIVNRLMRKEMPVIQLQLNPFLGRSQGSLVFFSPEEWVRVVEVMRAYFAQEEKLG